MANLICCADGNLTAAGTWATVDSTFLISTSTSATTLTTSDQSSAAFTPGAITIDAIALKPSSVGTGAAHTGTLTVTLYNSTDSVNVVSLAYNVAEIVNNGDARRCGWYLFKLDTTYLLVAGKSYLIKLKLSATAGQPAVSFQTNGTAANFQHMLRTTTTTAPAAGDDMVIAGELAAPNTWTTRTVTMDSTANTDYGAGANESEHTPSLVIGKNGTLTWGTAESTAYILKLSGDLIVFPGGAMNMGTVAIPCPRTSSMTLQFDTGSSKAYYLFTVGGVNVRSTLVMQGLSRTVGKHVDRCKLNQNLAVGGTTCNVDTDTGWLVGDEIVIAPTDQTYTHKEAKTLTTSNAGASSFTVAAVSYAHGGTAPVVAEVILLSRNVQVIALNGSYPSYVYAHGTSNCDWVRFTNIQLQYSGSLGGSSGNFDYCAADGAPPNYAFYLLDAVDGHIRNCVASTTSYGVYVSATASTNWTLQDCWVIGAGSYGIYLADIGSANALSNLIVAGCNNYGIYVADSTAGQYAFAQAACHPWVAHSNAGDGIYLLTSTTSMFRAQTLSTWTSYFNAGIGILLAAYTAQYTNCVFDAFTVFGNATCGVRLNSRFVGCRAVGWLLAGHTSFAQPIGVQRTQGSGDGLVEIDWDNCTFGVATGSYVSHSTADFSVGTSGATYVDIYRWRFRNCNLGSATKFDAWTNVYDGSFRSQQRTGQVNATHSWFSPTRGTIASEAATYHTAAPSEKLTPSSASRKLQSGLRHVAINSGATATVTVWVRKDATYNGAAPRLILRRNDAIGVAADTILDTFSVGVDEWEQLSGVTNPAAIDNGVAEVFVDCDGTAGSIFVDDWAVS